MKTCVIFAALDVVNAEVNIKSADLVIAADGGYKNTKRLNIQPDIILGDFDSLGYVPTESEIIKHPVMKDDTDTLLAIKVGLERGCSEFLIYGGIGGRLDHTLANIASLLYIAENGGRGYLISDNECITVIKNSSITFSEKSKGDISVFAVDGTADGVTISGLLYPLDSYKMTSAFPIGVSNSFIGKKAEISVKNGAITVVWNGGFGCLLRE